MKTKNFIVLCLLFFGLAPVFGQHQDIPVYPIPSYNVCVYGLAEFSNQLKTPCENTDGKRQVHVHLDPVSSGYPDCEATVWVYSLDEITVLGPFTVDCGQTLDVEIDERDWGVLVNSEEKLIVDVWFSEE